MVVGRERITSCVLEANGFRLKEGEVFWGVGMMDVWMMSDRRSVRAYILWLC